MVKNRELTEQKILAAVEQIIEKDGFEAVGVNAVTAVSGVNKVLIYRYFGSIDNLLAKYIEQKDFWLVNDFTFIPENGVKDFVKEIFHQYINMLKASPILRKLYRWELSTNNPVIENIRKKREEIGLQIIEALSEMSGQDKKLVAAISSLITGSVSYLYMLSENCNVYNSLLINEDSGWNTLKEGIDFMFNKIFD